jgi:hypothetical protein
MGNGAANSTAASGNHRRFSVQPEIVADCRSHPSQTFLFEMKSS